MWSGVFLFLYNNNDSESKYYTIYKELSRYLQSLSMAPVISWTKPLPDIPGEFSPRPLPAFRRGDKRPRLI